MASPEKIPTPPTLNYAPPAPFAARILPKIPRFSLRAFICLIASGAFVWWFCTDHDPWVIEQSSQIGISNLNGHLSADAKRVLGNSDSSDHLDGNFAVRDSASGQIISQFQIPPGYYDSAILSADGSKVLAKGGPHYNIHLWNADTGAKIAEIRWPADTVGQTDMYFSPDGSRIVTFDNVHATLYDSSTGKKVASLEQALPKMSYFRIQDAAFFSPDGSKIAISTSDFPSIRIHDTRDGKLISTITPDHMRDGGEIAASFSPDSKIFAYATGGWIDEVDPGTGNLLASPFFTKGHVYQLSFSPDGARICAFHDAVFPTRALTLLDPKTVQPLATTQPLWEGSLIFSPTHREIIDASRYAPGLTFLDYLTLKPRPQLANCTFGNSGRPFSPDTSKAAAINGRTHQIDILSAATWQPSSSIRRSWPQTRGEFTDAIFLNDSSHLLTTTNIGELQLWRLRRPESRWGIIVLPQFWLATIAFILVLISIRRDIRIWYAPLKSKPQEPGPAGESLK